MVHSVTMYNSCLSLGIATMTELPICPSQCGPHRYHLELNWTGLNKSRLCIWAIYNYYYHYYLSPSRTSGDNCDDWTKTELTTGSTRMIAMSKITTRILAVTATESTKMTGMVTSGRDPGNGCGNILTSHCDCPVMTTWASECGCGDSLTSHCDCPVMTTWANECGCGDDRRTNKSYQQ